jgi:hypothetical protein
MSIEDVQKVNQLAQELLNKGFASTREEAVEKAQGMLNKEITAANVETKETDNNESSGNSEERLKNIVERTKEHFERQLAAYKNALVALEKEINSLKEQIKELKSSGVAKSAADSGIAEKKVEEASQPQKELPKEESSQDKESNPRTGSHQPDDVSIEKMFYYGNK